jgi:hypothetical protein
MAEPCGQLGCRRAWPRAEQGTRETMRHELNSLDDGFSASENEANRAWAEIINRGWVFRASEHTTT